jgi:L-rhamnose mutarotase
MIQVNRHCLLHPIHHLAQILAGLPAERDGLAYDQMDDSLPDLSTPFGHNSMAPLDGDGNNVTPGLQGEVESTGFERLEPSVATSGPLWKNQHRGAVLDPFRSFMHAFQRLPWFLPFNTDVSGSLHGMPENRDLHEFLLDDKFEIYGQGGKEREYVKITAMVRHVNVWDLLLNVLGTNQHDLYAAHLQNRFCPGHGAVEMNESRTAAQKSEKDTVGSKDQSVERNKKVEEYKAKHNEAPILLQPIKWAQITP